MGNDQSWSPEATLESQANTLAQFVGKEQSVLDVAGNPIIQAFDEKINASLLNAKSKEAQHWPLIALQMKSSLDYPNVPYLEQVQQNTISLNVQIPIFEWGRVSNEVAAAKSEANVANAQRAQLALELNRNWFQLQDKIAALTSQKMLDVDLVKEAEEFAKLVYDSYKAGRSSYLDVQQANVKALQYQVQAVATNSALLVQLASLASLSTKGEEL
jgi:outer membrane protein TolC